MRDPAQVSQLLLSGIVDARENRETNNLTVMVLGLSGLKLHLVSNAWPIQISAVP